MLFASLHIEWVVIAQAVPHIIKSAYENKDLFIKENYIFMQIRTEEVISDKVLLLIIRVCMY